MSAFPNWNQLESRVLARVKDEGPSAKKVFETRELRTQKSLGAPAANAEVPRLILMLTAAGVSTCMMMALEQRQFLDCVLVTLIIVPYPPFLRKFKWLLLTALLSTEVWWKVKCAIVFAFFHAMVAIDWDYAMETVKNAKGIVL